MSFFLLLANCQSASRIACHGRIAIVGEVLLYFGNTR